MQKAFIVWGKMNDSRHIELTAYLPDPLEWDEAFRRRRR
jgi:hypothetical protein